MRPIVLDPGHRIEEVVRLDRGGVSQQLPQLRLESGVGVLERGDPGLALGGRHVKRLVEQTAQLRPDGWIDSQRHVWQFRCAAYGAIASLCSPTFEGWQYSRRSGTAASGPALFTPIAFLAAVGSDGKMDSNALLTDLLRMASDGDALAFNELFSATYADLRALAQSRLRSHGRSAQLDTTSLVHESYLRFVNAQQLNIADRGHFMRYAGQVMRSVIVDCVRERLAQRRGGDLQQVTLTTRLGGEEYASESQILAVHDAVDELGKLDERLARVVEMRFFAGMTEPEIAEVLGVTDRTVRRDWEKARLLLRAALQS